jgi:hypothetical protein
VRAASAFACRIRDAANLADSLQPPVVGALRTRGTGFIYDDAKRKNVRIGGILTFGGFLKWIPIGGAPKSPGTPTPTKAN